MEELQQEEREVLLSIYDGDENFIDLGPTHYQYKVGDNDTPKSALIDISWGDNYPDDLPTIDLDVFYNKHLRDNVKKDIHEKLQAEAEALQGTGSTYTLFEYAKENYTTLLEMQPEAIEKTEAAAVDDEKPSNERQEVKVTKTKKEHMSKNQKRRMYDKFGTQGMTDGKQRGWDWVDIVKHLSQTGAKSDDK